MKQTKGTDVSFFFIFFFTSRLSNIGLDLLLQMLAYDPEKRITCKDALQHDYWEEGPPMKDTDMMPTWYLFFVSFFFVFYSFCFVSFFLFVFFLFFFTLFVLLFLFFFVLSFFGIFSFHFFSCFSSLFFLVFFFVFVFLLTLFKGLHEQKEENHVLHDLLKLKKKKEIKKEKEKLLWEQEIELILWVPFINLTQEKKKKEKGEKDKKNKKRHKGENVDS